MQIDRLEETYLDTESPAAAERPAPPSDDEIEAAIARRRANVASARSKPKQASQDDNSSGGFCPQCGQPADADDRFCTHCGHQLIQPQHA